MLLVTLDTTRADHLGCYGYKDIATPNLDALANEGIRFEKAYTSCPMTFPAHASILTGQYPFTHGVRNNTHYSLSYDNTSMAELMKTAGWKTSAFIGATILEGRLGLKQGFDSYFDDMYSGVEKRKANAVWASRKAANVNYDFMNWLDTLPSDTADGPGWFAWVHYYDPHSAYDPPEPYASRYASNPYDGEIAYMDDALGRIINRLKEKDFYSNTLVVAIGDHGEGLGFHGEQFHSLETYNSTLHVPLIISDPDTRDVVGAVDSRDVSCVDLFPTILAWCGVDAPQTPGIDLLKPLPEDNPRRDLDRAIYFESMEARISYNWAPLRGIIQGNSKFIYCPIPELYDLASDPNEFIYNNLYSLYPDRAALAKKTMDELVYGWRGALKSQNRALSPQEEEQMKSLGYISGGEAAVSDDDLEKIDGLSDIKTKADTIEKVGRLRELADTAFESGDYGTARKRYLSLLKYADVVSASLKLGEIALKENDGDDAIKYLKHAVDLNPKVVKSWYDLGVAYHTFNRKDEAVKAWEMAIELNPGDPINVDSYVGLALDRSVQSDWPKALDFVIKARAIDNSRRDLIGYEASIRYTEGALEEEVGKKITDRISDPRWDGTGPDANQARSMSEDGSRLIREAYLLYVDFLSTGGGNLSNYFEAGQAAIHEKDYKSALDWIHKARELVPREDSRNIKGLDDLISLLEMKVAE